jgi:hypothetical protein
LFATFGASEHRRGALPPGQAPVLSDIPRGASHGMFHGHDSPRTPARRPIASPGPLDAYSPFPSARASPGAALASHHHALSNAIATLSGSSGRRSPRRGATHPAWEGPSDWSSRAAEMEAMLERKLERAESTHGGDLWRVPATPDVSVSRDPPGHVGHRSPGDDEQPDELRRRVRELQARLARAERELASDRARRVSRESPTRAATRSANAELAALTYENERLRRRCADAEAMSARLRSAAALAAAASPA